MLTPAFELRQDKDFLTLMIKAPFAKVAETEIFIEEDDFKFFSKPYFLRLTLPGRIVEDGREKADYNADNGEFTIVVPKETPGEHFEGLDMLTKLLEPKGKKSKPSPLIEVLGVDSGQTNTEEIEEDAEFDWRVEQVPYKEQPSLIDAPKYGFANQKSGVFARLQEDMVCIVDCSDPDKMTVAERREERIQAEKDKFDDDHYIADLYECDLIKPILDFTPHWYEEIDLVKAGTPPDIAVELTKEEKEVMRKLPRKEYLLDTAEETCVYFGLVDILYAYCYNHRTTEGENNCESGWTICKVSPTLSWLEVFSSIEEVLRSCYRRCLCYPLYRHWSLNKTLQKDVEHILKLGRRSVLKILLEIRQILMDQDCRYVLNDLYITDYCVWIQSISEKNLQSLSDAVSKLKLSKTDVGLNLPELEKLAQHAMQSEEQKDIENLTEKLSGIRVEKSKELDSDSESDESDTESNDDTAESSDELSSETEVEADSGDGIRKEAISNSADSGNVKVKCDNLSLENEADTISGDVNRKETRGNGEACRKVEGKHDIITAAGCDAIDAESNKIVKDTVKTRKENGLEKADNDGTFKGASGSTSKGASNSKLEVGLEMNTENADIYNKSAHLERCKNGLNMLHSSGSRQNCLIEEIDSA